MKPDGIVSKARWFVARRCPSGRDDHQVLEGTDEALAALGLGPGARLHVDRSRQPRNGDLVWAEVIRHGNSERLVRRYSHADGFVTLSAVTGEQAAIMRRPGELLVLGVVEIPGASACPM